MHELDLIRHHAETTFAEDITIVKCVQCSLVSQAYTPEPLMIDAGRTQKSEHAVAARQNLWRDAVGQSGE